VVQNKSFDEVLFFALKFGEFMRNRGWRGAGAKNREGKPRGSAQSCLRKRLYRAPWDYKDLSRFFKLTIRYGTLYLPTDIPRDEVSNYI
jgi:hypothetical protein